MMEISAGNFDLVAWATEVVDRRAALMAWCRLMPPVLERFRARALASHPIDVDLVVELGEELAFCSAHKEAM